MRVPEGSAETQRKETRPPLTPTLSIHTHSPASPLFLAAAAVPSFLEPVLAGASAAGAALASNHVFMAGFWAWLAAQVAKARMMRKKRTRVGDG